MELSADISQDCAQWLNGRGIGAHYDGTYWVNGQGSQYIGSCDGKYSGTVAGLGDADYWNIKNFISAQISAFEKADGWIFWCWKNEAAPEWHFKVGLPMPDVRMRCRC